MLVILSSTDYRELLIWDDLTNCVNSGYIYFHTVDHIRLPGKKHCSKDPWENSQSLEWSSSKLHISDSTERICSNDCLHGWNGNQNCRCLIWFWFRFSNCFDFRMAFLAVFSGFWFPFRFPCFLIPCAKVHPYHKEEIDLVILLSFSCWWSITLEVRVLLTFRVNSTNSITVVVNLKCLSQFIALEYSGEILAEKVDPPFSSR